MTNRAGRWVFASGNAGKFSELEALLERLHVGPPGARVVRVDAIWRMETGEFTGFTIRT